VYYASLPNRLLIWVVRHDAIDSYRQPISSHDLEEAIARDRAAVQDQSRADEAGRLAERLFDTLVGPYIDTLVPNGSIVIVPDGALHQLPFASLKNRKTGRYLVEDHTIRVTSSATMFLKARSALAARRLSGDAHVLVMDNPAVSAEDGRGLPDLSYAEVEGKAIAALYSNAVVVSGPDATKSLFVSRAGSADIVHFAGHAIANDSNPLLSRMLFASDASNHSGALFTNELLDMRFDRTALVVLAACRTGVGPVRKGEGPIGLARPFLARGVPSIVATLWDVNDRATATFFETFYRALRAGADTGAAMRQAQVAMIHDRDRRFQSPASWAGFLALGS